MQPAFFRVAFSKSHATVLPLPPVTWLKSGFLVFCILACVSGCRRSPVADYDRLKLQLVEQAFAALAAGDTARAITSLRRLEDMEPEQSFFSLALLREQERQAVTKLNALLYRGAFAEAERYLKEQAQNAGALNVILAGQPLVTALLAVNAYRTAPVPHDSKSMRLQLQSIDADCGVLRDVPDYQVWRAGEQRRLMRLEAEERRQLIRQLEEAFDVGVLRGDPQAGERITRIREVDATYPLAVLSAAAAAGAWNVFREWNFTEPAERAAAERVACQRWRELPPDLKNLLRESMAPKAAETLPGTLLRALLYADAGAIAEAVRSLRTLVGKQVPAAPYLRDLLSPGLLWQEQFDAHCWRSPCPSVADCLNRLAQVRAHAALRPKKPPLQQE